MAKTRISEKIKGKIKDWTKSAVSQAAPVVKKEATKMVCQAKCNVYKAVSDLTKVGLAIGFTIFSLKPLASNSTDFGELATNGFFIVYNETTNNYYSKEVN